MASLIDWLKYSGARTSAGAVVASGSAWFFQPDTTTTQVTVYSDEDGLTPVTQPVTLDAAGKATVYTKTPVRVEIQDSTGARVDVTDRSNTISAAQVEIENTVATGTSLTTGTQVEGGRTDLNTFLSNLRASLGAADGNVLVDGVATSIQNALYGLSSVFNVKRYGATGDGTTDDTVAVQAAITACIAAGGGTIWIPDGVYALSSALTCSTNTWFRFVGASGIIAGAVLRQTTNATAIFTGTNFNGTFENLTFNGTGSATMFTSLGGMRFVNCRFTPPASSASPIALAASSRPFFVNCYFDGTASASAYFSGASSVVHVANSFFSVTATNVFSGSGVVCTGCDFTNTTVTAIIADSMDAMFSGCNLSAITGTVSGGTSDRVFESGCILSATGMGATFDQSTFRDSNMNRTSGSATSYAADASLYKYHYVISTGASFAWSNPTNTGSHSGRELVLIYKNTSGGPITPTYGSAVKANTAVSVANGNQCAWHFVWSNPDGIWMQVGLHDDYTP